MAITKKQVAKYIFLPEILPRAKELTLNLSWFAYLMALIFSATGLLPPQHRFLQRGTKKDYGIQDVLFEAGHNLKGGVRHIDQYILYGSFVLGTLLLLGQFVILLFVIATHAAEASMIPGVPSFRGMFVTRDPENDLALMMLDKVFAIPNMFNSKFDPALIGLTPFADALHRIFFFYNQGMLLIATLIFVYYIFAVTIETAQTGTPFGKRFQEVYVPMRIILALALLVPMGYGFSAGQMLALKLGQWGSGFATNAWIIFNQRAELNPLGADSMALAVLPKTEDVASLLRFYSLAQSCRSIYMVEYSKVIRPYVIYRNGNRDVSVDANGLDYDSVLGYSRSGVVTTTFGEKNDAYTSFPGSVKPYCGSISLSTGQSKISGARLIHATYWEFMQELWMDSNLMGYGSRKARNFTQKTDASAGSVTAEGWSNADRDPEPAFYTNVRAELQARFEAAMEEARSQLRDTDEAQMRINGDLLQYGWGGAGIWFNKIAEYNGAVVSANHSVPQPTSFPAAMTQVVNKKRESENNIRSLTQFIPTLTGGRSLRDAMSGAGLDDPAKDGSIATFLGDVYNDMTMENLYSDGTEVAGDNVLANTVNAIFGTEGLFELRGNQQIHPLAKMSALGKSIIDRAITYIGGAMVMGGLSGLASILDKVPGITGVGNGLSAAFQGIGGMFLNFAFIGVIVGIVLYYVIPFLPFLYFFFAVGRWVKTIFEALVGIPLWALAHMRIDGEGVAGDAATQGYLLLLEILLRPILIVLGLMAAVSCFSALAIMLDTVFDLVLTNVTGYNPVDASGAYSAQGIEFKRSHVDQFFYTVVYAILLYMMAMACFKLIDLIPAGVLRFIGSGVGSFNDEMNLEQNLVRYTALSAYGLTREAGEAAQQLGTAVGQGAAFPINMGAELGATMKGIQQQAQAATEAAPPQASPQAPAAAPKAAAETPTPAAEPAAATPTQAAPQAQTPAAPKQGTTPAASPPASSPTGNNPPAAKPAGSTTPPSGNTPPTPPKGTPR